MKDELSAAPFVTDCPGSEGIITRTLTSVTKKILSKVDEIIIH
jgi:hypothetical protein